MIKGRNNYFHWKLSANLLGGLQKALISGNALVFLTTSLHSLTEVTTSSMVSVNFLMITSFSSPSHCFYHIPNDKTTLHANVPINATHNPMIRMQVSQMVDIFRKPRSFRYSILHFCFWQCFTPNCSGKKHMNEFTTEDYKKFKQEQGHKIHGWFLFGKPALSINDVDLIKQIQVLPLSYHNSF